MMTDFSTLRGLVRDDCPLGFKTEDFNYIRSHYHMVGEVALDEDMDTDAFLELPETDCDALCLIISGPANKLTDNCISDFKSACNFHVNSSEMRVFVNDEGPEVSAYAALLNDGSEEDDDEERYHGELHDYNERTFLVGGLER